MSGYSGDPKVECKDIDECSAKSHTCHVDADCTNYKGGYTCKCKTGYSGDGKLCKESIETLFLCTKEALFSLIKFFYIDPVSLDQSCCKCSMS